jgi:hypothetical protein
VPDHADHDSGRDDRPSAHNAREADALRGLERVRERARPDRVHTIGKLVVNNASAAAAFLAESRLSPTRGAAHQMHPQTVCRRGLIIIVVEGNRSATRLPAVRCPVCKAFDCRDHCFFSYEP